MKNILFTICFFLSSFIIGQNLYFDFPHDGQIFETNTAGYYNFCYRILDPSPYYYDLGDFEVRLHKPNGETTNWLKKGKTGCFELIYSGNYWIQARVKVNGDLGGQNNYYLYSYQIHFTILDNNSPAVPANFNVVGNLNQYPSLYWNVNTERDIDGYVVEKELNINGSIENFSTFTKNSFFIDSTFFANYKTGLDRVVYWVKAKDVNNNLSNESNHYEISGSSLIQMKISFDQYNDEILNEFCLLQNYPNPFNPSTTINFSLKESGFTKLDLFNCIGEKIKNIISEFKESGSHSIQFNAENLPSGIYIITLTQGNNFTSSKIQLMK